MLAASFWSLLAPAISIAEESGKYGAFAFLPVSFGFFLGAVFVLGADLLIPHLSGSSVSPAVALGKSCCIAKS